VWLGSPQMAVAEAIAARASANEGFTDTPQTGESSLADEAGEPAEKELTVVVRDCGSGADTPATNPGLGLGLRLIASLAKSARVTSDVDMRTEVEMTFSLNGPDAPSSAAASEPDSSSVADAPAALTPRGEPDESP
jgi:hypothetical protein